MQSFAKIKSLQNGGITLLFTDTEKINMSFNAIRENKILAKTSELTVVNKEVWTGTVLSVSAFLSGNCSKF